MTKPQQRHIEIIAPGGRSHPADLQHAVDWLASQGCMPSHAQYLLGNHVLYAHNESQRFQNLHHALYGEADVLWALRGGCGTSRLVHQLLSVKAPDHPKTLIGFSDITALLLMTAQQWGWKPIHGPVLRSLTTNHISQGVRDSLNQLLETGTTSITQSIKQIGDAKTPIMIEGLLTGGNLALVQRSLGTPWQIDTHHKIVFLEDIHEPPYRVAELLDHLLHTGSLQKAQAVIFGAFTQGSTHYDDQFAHHMDLVFHEFQMRFQKPVFTRLNCGHIAENYPLQLHQRAVIAPQDKRGSATFTQTIHL